MGSKNFKKGRRNEPIGETIDERDESKKLQKNFLNRANSIGTKGFGKQSVDYDDTEFLEKMFSNVDSDIRNISKANGSGHLNSVGNIKTQNELSVMEGNKLIEEELEKVTSRDAYNTEAVKASPTKVIGIISEENSAPTIKTNQNLQVTEVSNFRTEASVGIEPKIGTAEKLDDGGAVYNDQDPMTTFKANTYSIENPLYDEDIQKIDRLQLINASARYQLLSANHQLLDFHLDRIMKNKAKAKGQTNK